YQWNSAPALAQVCPHSLKPASVHSKLTFVICKIKPIFDLKTGRQVPPMLGRSLNPRKHTTTMNTPLNDLFAVIGDKLRAIRHSRNEKIVVVAYNIGVSHAVISQIE